MKKRLMAVLTSLCMMSALMPAAAFATDGDSGVGRTTAGKIRIGDVEWDYNSGPHYAKTDENNEVREVSSGDDWSIMWNGTNLTLKDANIVHTDGCAIDAEGDLYIILEGGGKYS